MPYGVLNCPLPEPVLPQARTKVMPSSGTAVAVGLRYTTGWVDSDGATFGGVVEEGACVAGSAERDGDVGLAEAGAGAGEDNVAAAVAWASAGFDAGEGAAALQPIANRFTSSSVLRSSARRVT